MRDKGILFQQRLHVKRLTEGTKRDPGSLHRPRALLGFNPRVNRLRDFLGPDVSIHLTNRLFREDFGYLPWWGMRENPLHLTGKW